MTPDSAYSMRRIYNVTQLLVRSQSSSHLLNPIPSRAQLGARTGWRELVRAGTGPLFLTIHTYQLIPIVSRAGSQYSAEPQLSALSPSTLVPSPFQVAFTYSTQRLASSQRWYPHPTPPHLTLLSAPTPSQTAPRGRID